jgi:hypothetical protein
LVNGRGGIHNETYNLGKRELSNSRRRVLQLLGFGSKGKFICLCKKYVDKFLKPN